MEVYKLTSDVMHHIYLLQNKLIQVGDVLTHITPWLINFIQKSHLTFDQVYQVINVLAMTINQLLLFLKNLLNELLMLVAKSFRIVLELLLKLLISRHFISESIVLIFLHWLLLSMVSRLLWLLLWRRLVLLLLLSKSSLL